MLTIMKWTAGTLWYTALSLVLAGFIGCIGILYLGGYMMYAGIRYDEELRIWTVVDTEQEEVYYDYWQSYK